MHIRADLQIACPPDVAFDLMADAREEPAWNSQVSRVELKSGEPIGLGSEFELVNRGEAFQVTVSRYERPQQLEFRGVGSIELVISHTFTGQDGGTHLESEYDFRPRGAMKMLFSVMKPVIGSNVKKQLASFKTLCEQRAAGA